MTSSIKDNAVFSINQESAGSVSEELELQANILNKDDIKPYLYLEGSWWKHKHFRYLNFCIFLTTLTSTNNGYDSSMLNGLQSLSKWKSDMSHPAGPVLGALNNGNTFGVMLSFVVASFIADKIGRKYAIMLGSSITILGAILQGVSTNYAFFLISRMVIGFGSGIAIVSSPSLISEISYPTHRPTATALYNVFWYLGAIIAAWVTFGTRILSSSYCWRVPSYLQGALPFFQVVCFWMVPESPRYLISKGKNEKAREILHKFHTGSSQDERAFRLVEFEMKEIESALELEKLYANTKYADFFTIASFRKRLFLVVFVSIIMQLSGNGLVSYYLSKVLNSIGITGQKEQLEINGCLMIYNLVVAGTVATFVDRFKRRTLFLFSTGMMLILYVIWTILSAINQQRNFEQKSLGNGVLAMIFLYYAAYDVGANGLPWLYMTEILPYSHRAKGINIHNLVQTWIVVYNGFVNAIAMDAIEWKYYIVYCCILAVEFTVVYFTFVETSGYTLEEVAKVFGDDAESTLKFMSAPSDKLSFNHSERKSNKGDSTRDYTENV
ncbi:general substrate transporter [Scheffersomyces coipomensis]|uniref:general substrate transporter n=1 Tax=Scheffersomyces coipomensis TaxID=1788519 RepID=UPI00315DD8FF